MKKIDLKRLVAVGGATVVAVGCLTACGSGSDSTATGDGEAYTGALTVLDYYTDEPDNTIYQEFLETCATEVGVTIERDAIPGTELVKRILQMSSSKTLPDILMIDNPDLAQIAATGALTPLEDLGLDAGDEIEGIVSAATYDGKLYGLQPITNSIALYYRPSMLEEAGVEVPTTWAELRQAAAALTKGDRYGLAFAAGANYEGAWTMLPFMWSNGVNEDDLNTPEMAEAIQLWVDLMKDGSVSDSIVNWTQADVNDQFKAGNAAMMINGPWQHPSLNDSGIDYALASLPAPKEGVDVQVPFGGETWTVPVNSDPAKAEAAGKVIKCLNSDENEMEIAKQRNTVPTSASLMEKYAEEMPKMKAYTEMIPTARARTAILGAGWPEAATQIYESFQLALVDGKTPQEALDQVVGSN